MIGMIIGINNSDIMIDIIIGVIIGIMIGIIVSDN